VPQDSRDVGTDDTLTSRLLAAALLLAVLLTGVALVTDQPLILIVLLACSTISVSRCFPRRRSLDSPLGQPNDHMALKRSTRTGESP
jgi:hypothetical protein